jgi:hypothetical protein
LIDPEPRIAVFFHDRDEEVMLGKGGVKPISSEDDPDSKPAIWEASMRFGLVMLKGQDPQKPGQRKRLTFDEKGFTNNTCVRLEGKEFLFGERPFRLRESGRPLGLGFAGHWKSDEERDVYSPADGKSRGEGRRSVWVYDAERIQITQFVEVVPGEQSRLLDTCLVRYLIQNQDTRPHLVGLRFLLDTYIGANDGVPFTIPGARTLCDTQQVFDRPEAVPDFIQALERENLRDPGTVAQVQLRLGGRLEAPSRVSLGAWPNPELADRDPRCRQEKTLWEVPVFPIKTLKTPDSAVTLYWDEKELPPGGRREVGFSYGLGNVASTEGAGRLGLSVGGRFQPGGEFTLTALVSEPLPEESLTLELPQSFQILDGGTTQPVPSVPAGAVRRTSPLSWRIKAGPEGTYTLQVKSSAGASQKLDLRIRSSSIFD